MARCVEDAARTWTGPTLSDEEVAPSALVVCSATGIDDRSALPFWGERETKYPGNTCRITEVDRDSATANTGGAETSINLRDDESLLGLFEGRAEVCVDISGLSHSVWASLVRAALGAKWLRRVTVAYAEPLRYSFHASPASPTMFDLSDGFDGLAPLPGFAKLGPPPSEGEAVLVAFLGFEGSRPRVVAAQLDPSPRVIPVVGMPGFQMELPTYTVASNREFLDEYRAGAHVRFARANCPFEAMAVLDSVARDYADAFIYVAPVGTKPHALGVVMFALLNPSRVEILYDHPRRRHGRTKGVGSVHLYRLHERQ